MRKTILLLLLLFCVVLFGTGAEGCDGDNSTDIIDIPVCDSDLTPQECEDAVVTMPEGGAK